MSAPPTADVLVLDAAAQDLLFRTARTANTFTELTRLKTFYVLLLFALLLIGNSIFMAQLTFQQEFQVLKDIALGSMSISDGRQNCIALGSLREARVERSLDRHEFG